MTHISIPFGWQDWWAVMPPTVAGCSALVVLIADLVLPKGLRRSAALIIAALGLAAAGVIALGQWGHTYAAFGGGFMLGGFTLVFEEIVVVAALFSLLMASGLGREDQAAGGIALLLWSASGAMLMAGAGNLMTIFL